LEAFAGRLVPVIRRRHNMIVAIVEGVTMPMTVVHVVPFAKSAVAASALRDLRAGSSS